MRLALFDLDHTLLPFDSGMAWTRFLVARGELPPGADARYLARCQDYVAGALDIHALFGETVGALRAVPRERLAAWLADFERDTAPRVPAACRALVARHREAGDRCVLVTATVRFLAEPCARLLGLTELLATEAATVDGRLDGPYSGRIAGQPCHREHKLARVTGWLGAQGLTLAACERSWFYSDSAGDLPLLQAVSDPVAVAPDARLRAVAAERGWPVIERAALA